MEPSAALAGSGKVQLLFTTTVFLLGQSVLHHLDDSALVQWQRPKEHEYN